MHLAPMANTANHARALRRPFHILKRSPVIPLTADLASKAGGQDSIIEKHKYDETPCPCDPEPAAAETKKAPDFSIWRLSKYGVDDGDRTHDNGSHNPVLYQLSYAHHIAC